MARDAPGRHKRRQLSACKDVRPDGKLFCAKDFFYARIYPIITPRDKNNLFLFCKRARFFSGQHFSAGRENDYFGWAIPPRARDGFNDRLSLEYHARTSSKRTVVNRLVGIFGEIAWIP